ncbi:DNA-binding transcriptional regulator [Pseudorhodoferax sp. LjRoot39]|uniref:DNA-binding transcriptional regulator n=1 Tax=Pseudorhodoferax sp. LjRoot39 TaxID=3342328 RepID=UPI003ECDC405
MRARLTAQSPPYKEVRGLARGLEVLRALNRVPGGIGATSELARICGLDRTTTKRLLETLRQLGLVRPGDRDGQYCLTFDVRSLSEGFEDEAWVGKVALPSMQAAARELMWPCDLGTAEAGFMVVRESTHRWSTLSQHRAMIGERLPLLATAIGRAYLSACAEVEREGLLELLRVRDDWIGDQARDTAAVKRMVRATQRRGYSVNEGEWIREAGFAAIALPVFAGPRLLAALNMVFPKGAIAPAELRRRYLPMLQQLAETIGKNSEAWI